MLHDGVKIYANTGSCSFQILYIVGEAYKNRAVYMPPVAHVNNRLF